MKNLFIVLILGLSTSLSMAQVGIFTDTPEGTLDVHHNPSAAADVPQGVLHPKATTAQRDAWTNPPVGLTIFNITRNCIETNIGTPASPEWRCTASINDPTSGGNAVISSFDDCTTASAGTLTAGTAVSSVTQTITVTVATAGSYNISATANGITFSGTGTLSTGSQSIVLTATGTPATVGSSIFTLNTTPNCSFSRNVEAVPYPVPANITLGQNQSHTIASIYDTDYIPYAAPTGPATTNSLDANGSTDPTVDIQGTLTTAGVQVLIPVTATGNGTLPAFSQTKTVPAHLTEDGVSRNVTLSWASQSYDTNTQYITATLAAVGGTLYAKKLDINAGLGSDHKGILLSSFDYTYDNTGSTTTLELRDIAAIPDKMFSQITNGALQHQFLYLPVQVTGANGYNETWLNMNLGAEYADINSPSFNPGVALYGTAAHTDSKTYGSLFQWQRKPDGHEFRTSPVTREIASDWDASGTWDHQFILQHPWVDVNSSGTLENGWGPSGVTNPCPHGFHVPTKAEWESFAVALFGQTSGGPSDLIWYQMRFQNLPAAGRRSYQSYGITDVNYSGNYWTSNKKPTSDTWSFIATFKSSTWQFMGVNTANSRGLSVRCIKD